MKMKFTSLAGLLLVISLAACNLPGKTPEPVLFPTPDYTLTAIFSALNVLTATPQPSPVIVSTATAVPPLPTATSAPPSPTMIVLPTITSLPLPTNTPFPTSTPWPTPSATIPAARTAASVVATFITNPPTIDGNLSDWNLGAYQIPYVVFGTGDWRNDDDLSGDFMIGWDQQNIYIAFNVTDNRYVQNAKDKNLYEGDSVEILLDTKVQTDYYTQWLSPDDFQLGLSAGNGTPGHNRESWLWYPTSLAGNKNLKIKFAGVAVTGGYTLEAAIPWSLFETTPYAGAHYGFAASISDTDREGTVKQETMISNVRYRSLVDPTTWGDLLLGAH